MNATTITIIVVIAALMVDTFFLKVYDLFGKDPTSVLRSFVFLGISLIYCVGQYIVLKFVKLESREIRILKTQRQIAVLHNIVKIVQYILTAILVYVILQIVITLQYSTVFISIATTISCILGCCMLVILTQRFFLWFKTNKDHVVLLYGLSSAALSITSVVLFVFVDIILSSTKPDSIMPKVGGTGLYIAPGTTTSLLDYIYVIFSILSFALTWLATSMLLRHHSKKIGQVKYMILIAIPLVYFSSQFFGLFLNVFTPLLRSDPVFYGILLTGVFAFSKLAGGIFFGIAFWMAARRISRDSIVRKYMIISAYGLVLLFITIQINGIIVTSYPPFGLVTVSFLGLSTYLILIGIYSSAVSVSEDSKLRQSLRSIALKDSELLGSIGTAEMEQQIIKKVVTFTKQNQARMVEESGIEPSLTEEDMKIYLEEVISEVSKSKQG
ncbi:MAG: hypothetical protein JO327_11390 [Nitrososphaeraceae archaeon]|nr:hypothetical protein [Nitrososphaeraceae archaeon]